MQLRTHRFLTNESAQGAESTYLTDFRFNDIPDRTIQGVLLDGAEVSIFTYLDKEDDTVAHLVGTFSDPSFSTVIQGPVARIQVVKSNTAGTASVEGLV